jgi:hypothetical protein
MMDNKGGAPLMLGGFDVHKQETPVSCGPASVLMALEMMGITVPESRLRRKMHTSKLWGTMPGMVKRGYQRYLRKGGFNLNVRILSGRAVTTHTLAESLQKGRPVVVSFYTENHFNPGNIVGHYAVVCGIDESAGKVYLANPFGTKDELDLDRFWKMTEYDLSDGKTSFGMKLALILGKLIGMVKPRLVFVLEDE